MKVKTLSVLAGLGGALIMSSNAEAIHLVANVNTSNAFLVANNLQSATIGITGWSAGDMMSGILGTANNPFTVVTGNGSGFFNVASTFDEYENLVFDGAGPYASTGATGGAPHGNWDSGLLPANGTGTWIGVLAWNQGIGNAISWAQHGNGAGSSHPEFGAVSSNEDGFAPPATLNVIRITWSRDTSATVSFLLAMANLNLGGGDVPLSITIPAVPAPGALALLGLAGLVGTRRRRA